MCNVGLVTGFFTMIKTIISTTVKKYIDLIMNNPFVGSYKVVTKIISAMENMLDFGNGGIRRRKTIG